MPWECLLPFNCSNMSLKREPDVDWVVMSLFTDRGGNPPLPFLSYCGWSNILLLLSHFSRVWLCDPMDCSLLGFSVHGILQARTLEWVAISFSNAWKWKVKVKSLSRVWLLATPWTADYQAPPSVGFSGQQYWSGVPLPSPGLIYRMD